MKIGLENHRHLHRGSSTSSGAKEHDGGTLRSAITAHTIKQDLNYNINTTASKNTRGRMSFKGASTELIKEAETLSEKLSKKLSKKLGKETKVVVTPKILALAKKIDKSPKLKKLLDFASVNSLLTEALFAILITCGLRPAVILASPGKGENKEKNQYAAAHSVASGLIGLGMTLLIAPPVKNAIDFIMPNTDEIESEIKLKKYKKLITGTNKELGVIRSVLERLHTPIFLPLRAAITISLIPIILKPFGIKKTNTNTNTNTVPEQAKILMPKNTKKIFQSFTGVSQNENK